MSTNKAKLEALLKLINSAAQEAIAEYEKAGGDVPSIDSTEPHPLDNDDAIDNIALKSAIRTLEGACAQLCTTLAPPSHTAINVSYSFLIPPILRSITYSSRMYTTTLASVSLSERRSPISSWITPRESMSTSSPRLSKSMQRSSRAYCVFWPPEVATTKVGRVECWSKDPTLIPIISGDRHVCKQPSLFDSPQ